MFLIYKKKYMKPELYLVQSLSSVFQFRQKFLKNGIMNFNTYFVIQYKLLKKKVNLYT